MTRWKFWKIRPKIHIGYTWVDDQGKKYTMKKLSDMTPEEQNNLRLAAIRQVLHCAVDKGLLDDNIREINEEETDR